VRVEFRILGPLEVSHAGEIVTLGGPREQTILAMLLLEANRVIPVDRLIDAVWDEDPPATARGQIQICISNMRRRILSISGQDLIDTRNPGYLLKLGDGTLDMHIFENRVAAGRAALSGGETARVAVELRAALSLWRGPALSSVDSTVVQSYVTRLNERRLAVLGECLDAELRAGAHHELIGELAEIVEKHPLQEHFRALFMTALFRGGRQAEALEAYRRTRDVLMDELGIEPGEELRRLHKAMLAGDLPIEEVDNPPAATGRSSVPPAASRTPSLLPAAIPDFTGRSEIIERLRERMRDPGPGPDVDQAVRVSVVVGQGGAGKTTLAVHVAHLLAPDYPDGQLFVRLRAGDRPVNPSDILERFLRVLGVGGSELPEGLEERAELFRDLVGGRRMLIVLDDAMAEQQVASLLPGNVSCAVIVTSRRRLTGLPAVARVEIGGFSRRSAIELLSRIVGPDRIAAEPAKVAELCRLCGDLPLALRIVAARLAARPHWSVADLLDRLVDESRRLDELNHGGMGVRASISLSYEGLSEDARILFRRLAVLDSPSFPSWVGAPLLQVPVPHAQDVLEELTEAYLIDTEPGAVHGRVRYRFHDIMRPFAREQLLEESADERRAGLERWTGAMLSLAGEAHRREYTGGFLAQRSTASRWPLPDSLVDRLFDDPLAWYEEERASIVAAVRQAAATGLIQHAWDLALSAVTLFESHSYLNDWQETHEHALKAACRYGDRLGEAAMRYSLGSLHMFEQHTAPARAQFAQAYALYEELGNAHGTALVLRNQAYLDRVNGDLDSALARWQEALEAFRLVGDRIAEAHVLHNLAQIRLDYGDQDAAYELLHRAERICDELGNRRVGAQVKHRLGELLVRRGEVDRAADAYAEVLGTVRASGDTVGECYALLGLASVDLRRGDLAASELALGRARELAIVNGEPMADNRISLAFAEVALESGNLDEAGTQADRAIVGFGEMGAALLRTSALVIRGRIHAAAGESEAAMTVWTAACGVLSELHLHGAVTIYTELQARMSGLATVRSVSAQK
jgi:DNA-binding SARP family transcriptional activator/tetratricopeptide (TPR) repeat protein/energy-coupling factor transporter ATP-binding protein EcfA2